MPARQPTGPPPPPVVARMRIRYAKRGRLRFTSHRDFARAFERALRRAEVPMGYSAGFSPHPKISYLGASPTGAASEAEYLEIGLRTEVDPEQIRTALDAALPPGLDILQCIVATGASLADRIDASRWRIELPGLDSATLERAVREFCSRDSVIVERVTLKGRRELDARAAVVRVETASAPGCAILDLVVRQVTPAVRPDDVLTALGAVAGLTEPLTSRSTRLAQGRLDDISGELIDPLGPDRAAAARGDAQLGA